MAEVWVYFEGRTGFADRSDVGCKPRRAGQVFGQDRVAIHYKCTRFGQDVQKV